MPFAKDGTADMFWPEPFNASADIQRCRQQWGVATRPVWATVEYGGRNLDAASNIVFTNGLMDPWY